MKLVGLDLGKRQDYTAVAVLDKGEDEVYTIKRLDRTRQTSYEEVAWSVARLMEALGDDAHLVADSTGVGDAVMERLEAHGLHFDAVFITGGNTERREGSTHYVPKRNLVATLEVLLEQKKLKIQRLLRHAGTLKKELQNFKYRISASGHDSYAADWRTEAHDDLVLAVALAAWKGERNDAWEPYFTGGGGATLQQIEASRSLSGDRGWTRIHQGW